MPSSPGEAISRFRDDTQVVSTFLTWTLDPLGQAIALVSGLVVLARIDPLITAAVMVPLIGVLALVNAATRRIHEYRRIQQEAIGDVTDLLGEIFGATTAVKVAGAEEQVMAHVQTLNEARRRATLRDLLLAQFLSSVSSNATNLGTGLLLLVAARAMHGRCLGRRFRAVRLIPGLALDRDRHVRRLPAAVPADRGLAGPPGRAARRVAVGDAGRASPDPPVRRTAGAHRRSPEPAPTASICWM